MSLTIFAKLHTGGMFLGRKNGGIDDIKVYAIKSKKLIEFDNHYSAYKNELRIWQKVRNFPFFVQLKYAFKTRLHCHFVMDYHPIGNLFEYIYNSRTLTIQEAKICSAEIVLAIAYLHEKYIIYRHLELRNILVSNGGHILLTDFSSATKGPGINELIMQNDSMVYHAPEMVLGDRHYSFEVDWWSLGISLYEMLTWQSPFITDNRSPEQSSSRTTNFESLHSLRGYSPVLEQFISQLLIEEPGKRLGTGNDGYKKLKSHPFFGLLNWSAVMLKKYKCLSRFKENDKIPIDQNDIVDVAIEKPPENDSKRFYYIAPELQEQQEGGNIQGSTEDDLENMPALINLPDSNCIVEINLTNDIFLRVNSNEGATKFLKQFRLQNEFVQDPEVTSRKEIESRVADESNGTTEALFEETEPRVEDGATVTEIDANKSNTQTKKKEKKKKEKSKKRKIEESNGRKKPNKQKKSKKTNEKSDQTIEKGENEETPANRSRPYNLRSPSRIRKTIPRIEFMKQFSKK